MKSVSITINDERVESMAEPRTHLADFLRDQLRELRHDRSGESGTATVRKAAPIVT